MQPASFDPQPTAAPTSAAGQPTSTDAGRDGQAPTGEGEIALVRKLTAEFEREEKAEKTRQTNFERWRQYQRGITPGATGSEAGPQFPVNVNLCQSTSQVLTSRLYARNPEVSISPSDAIHPSRFEAVRDFGRTGEVVINREFKRAKLKRRMRKQVRGTLTVGFAWLKAAMQIEQITDPIVQSRINDLTDNLAEIDRRMEELKAGGSTCEPEALQREELLMEMRAAQAKLEVQKATGLVLANPRVEDVIVSGDIRELEDYLEAAAITHRTWWRCTDVSATFGIDEEKLAHAQRYTLRGDAAAPLSVQANDQGEWLAVLEKWDRKAGMVHTWVHGCDYFLRPSAPPDPSSSRFYPFFLMAWNWLDDTRYPQSDTAQWAPLQDEYNSTRSTQRVHRKRSVPALVTNGAIVGPQDADRLANRDVNEIIALQGVDPNIPVGNLVAELANARMDPAVYDVKPILYDLDVVSGVQEAARQAIKSPKTATEAEIQDSAAQGRTGSRSDEIEAMLEELAVYTLELLLQAYGVEDVIRIAGEGAVWPELTIDELHQLCAIEIRAGSTGKPDTSRRQQTWATLLPVIQPIIERIHMLRRQAAGGQPMGPPPGMPAPGGAPGAAPGGDAHGGPNPMALLAMLGGGAGAMTTPPDPWAGMLADALEELLKETLSRADERMDVDRFLPKAPQQTSQQPGAMPGAPGGMPGQPAPAPAGPSALAPPAGVPALA